MKQVTASSPFLSLEKSSSPSISCIRSPALYNPIRVSIHWRMELQGFLCSQLAILCLFFFILTTDAATTNSVMAGDWNEIPDVLNNTHIQDLGMFAVLGYNNSTGSNLSFYAVFEAQAQIVAGLNFRMALQALDADFPRMYKACVWEKPWEGFRNLTSFETVLS